MIDALFLALIFAISATVGYLFVFQTYKVQAALVRIRDKYPFFGLWIWRWVAVSPYYILIIRIAGVVAWVIAAVTSFALLSRFVNRIP